MSPPPLPPAVQQYLAKANARLKSGGVKMEVRGSTNVLSIRGTFPPKPGSNKAEAHQQRISIRNESGLAVQATTVAAVQWVEQQAKRVSADLNLGQFDWGDWSEGAKESVAEAPSLDLIELWDEYVAHKKTHLSITTIEGDFERTRRHLVKMQENGIALGYRSAQDGLQYKDYLIENHSAKTARRILVMLNGCFSWAVARGRVEKNIIEGLSRSVKVKKPSAVDPFTAEEVRLIVGGFEQYSPHYSNYVKFLFLTGCRTSEASGLRWGSIDRQKGEIIFKEAWTGGVQKGTKTESVRTFPISGKLIEVLASAQQQRTEGQDYVFLAPKGGLIDNHNFLNRTLAHRPGAAKRSIP